MTAGGIGIVAGRIISEKANVSPDNLFVMLLAIGRVN